ncbi:SacI homology domain-containing protein [Armillaria nabsnona]|nr:SacI homology domain-containing protein [Armillaria nabsnona]
MKVLHQRLQLYLEGSDAYIFVPIGESVNVQSLTIDRATGEMLLNPPNTSVPPTAHRSGRPVYGILGTIALSMSEYVIIITGREPRGRIAGQDVYRATDFDMLPLNPNISVQHPPHPVEGHLLALLRSHLYGGVFLFSYGWDLTRRLQLQWEHREHDANKASWEVADDRFFWNRFLQTRLIDANAKQDLGAFILPVLYGTFDIRPAFVQGRHMQLALISRRSRFRAGTRYFRRGVDNEGHVANFNETEQILLVEAQNSAAAPRSADEFAAQLSFVQIRGSVPVFWAEVNTLRYKPDLQIMDLEDTPEVMKMHLLEQVSLYGDQTLVNLVNHKGHEKPVKEAYERYIAQINLPQVRYEYFDFHNECKNMRWDRISVLIDKVQDDLVRQSYFHVNAAESQPHKLQSGTVRTNCMDNLDRTNVVQAALAKWTLNQQLISLGILSPGGSIDEYPALSADFREMWADHADAIAKAYGGSGALKSDFTRTAQRTKKGLLEDGVKGVVRYLKNNYFDGARQDAFDLVTGTWVPRKNPSSSLFLVTDSRPLITRSMPAIASFSVFMICAGLTLPRTSEYSLFYYFLLWVILLTVAAVYMVVNGIDFVSWPKLIPPTDIIYYNGPGFRSARHGMGLGGGKDVKAGLGKTTKWLNGGRLRRGTVSVEDGEIKKRVD